MIHDIRFRNYFGQLAIIPGLVSEIHANFLKDMAWDLTEVNLEVVQFPIARGHIVCTSFVSFSANWPGPDSIA